MVCHAIGQNPSGCWNPVYVYVSPFLKIEHLSFITEVNGFDDISSGWNTLSTVILIMFGSVFIFPLLFQISQSF